ncbi:hypothetical protein PPERSA_07020 [Pseudocohnilembus persalinus]|uniref:Uncharacterized protein n=1 Tax=Pseudocohnilembus persalinus TaxID=266149 RepID=A0A0V0QMB5_PSEPJ|nr:hypothetical protein PPERSA_07020 [Pseudocohnilembus persalinus]|eukprot:KRX03192.1 hypothetical protein PPERSA_07020 [Pseudocohnilembus persalinus]
MLTQISQKTCSTKFEEISKDSSACTFYRFSVGTTGLEDFTDDCPTILENEDFQCTDTNDSSPNQSDTYDVFSLTSKCFEASIRESGSTVSQNQRCYQYELYRNLFFQWRNCKCSFWFRINWNFEMSK